jgi:hypothetical protein
VLAANVVDVGLHCTVNDVSTRTTATPTTATATPTPTTETLQARGVVVEVVEERRRQKNNPQGSVLFRKTRNVFSIGLLYHQ